MERWAANTLRIFGILLTAGITLIACAGLLLLSLCFGKGSLQSDKAVPFVIGGLIVMVGGLWLTIRLARGLRKPPTDASPAGSATPQPSLSQPLALSSQGQMAVDRLVFALGAQIVVGLICWFLNRRVFWTSSASQAGVARTLLLLLPFVLYHIPYVLLIAGLIRRVTGRLLVYSLVVSAMMTLEALIRLATGAYSHVQPASLLLIFLPVAIEVVIAVLAWITMRDFDIQPEASSVAVAAIITFVWLIFLNYLVQWIFRLAWR